MSDLTKGQKKICRKLISLGLQRDCTEFLRKTKSFINKNVPAEDSHDVYLKLFRKIETFDKYVARRYDGMTGGRYYFTVFSLYFDGVLTDEDIREFDDDMYNDLKARKAMVLD